MPRQLIPVVMTPPRTGPRPVATPVMAPQTPKATPRSLPWKLWARRAREVANRMAPPMPWALRERISISDDWASPQSSEPGEHDQADDEEQPAPVAVGQRAGGQRAAKPG